MNNEHVFRQRYELEGGNFSRAGRVSCRIKHLLGELGFRAHVIRRVAIATYEAEMNVIMYAWQGTVDLEVKPRHVFVVVEDHGPGIEDIDLAMKEGYSTATREMREMGFGAGMGLPNIKKNSDSFYIRSEPGKGTRLEMEFRSNGDRP
jgi:anti-sigma regulatory factor (Ser/Thr protein kinase)